MAIKRPSPPLAPGRQRGMALLVVLLILAVMVIVASNMSGRLQLELRRTANLTLGKQAWWYAMSAEALVIKVLNQDLSLIHISPSSPTPVCPSAPWPSPPRITKTTATPTACHPWRAASAAWRQASITETGRRW